MNPPAPTPPTGGPGGGPPPSGSDPRKLTDAYPPTVKVTPTPTPSGPRPSSTPTAPDEVSKAPSSARFGNFVRVQRLGAGGMGEVWKAWDDRLARWVALKFPKGGDEEEVARFAREAQTAGRLSHPNIAAIYEVGEDQGTHFIAMQYVEGLTLRAFPRDDRRALVRLIADAAQALQYAHEQGIVHRDLKPENLMVTTRSKAGRGEEHHVYVMDFGLARMTEGASNFSVSGLVVGTPSYMPPEQARGEKVDARADVYSLGATLYELLTGRRPFQGANVYETLKKVQEEDPRAPRKIDPRIAPDLETIMLKCLAKEPARRYASAQALAEDLLAFDAGESIQARPEGLTRRVWRKVRRNRAAALAAVAVLAAIVVAGYVAPKAYRDRQVASLVRQVDDRLKAGQWKEAEDLIAGLEGLAPAEARAARVRAFRESLGARDFDRAQKHVDVLASADAGLADRLRREIEKSKAVWTTVFKLEPPFAALASVFGADRVRAEGDVLKSSPDARPGAPIVTQKRCEGNVDLAAEFDPSWKSASRLGLILNAAGEGGYSFLLLSAENASVAGPAGPVSFEDAVRRGGAVLLQIRRNEAVLREVPVGAAGAFRRDAPLRLLAKREGSRLTFQVNDLAPLAFQDPFPLGRDRRGAFGVHWPPGPGLRRIEANRQELPPDPGLLEVGDDLYVRGRYEEALGRYREAGAAGAPSVRREARYKEALCHVACNREDVAVPLLEELTAGFAAAAAPSEDPWRFLADCQLLRIHFLKKDSMDRAEAVMDRLSGYGYGLDKLAMLFPREVRWPIINNTLFVSNADRYLLWRPEDTVRRLEIAVRLCETLEPPTPDSGWKRNGLLRAYWMAGREQDALRCAEETFRKYRYGGNELMDYCWILRRRGEHARALEAANRAVAASDFGLLVERARIHAATGLRDEALRDLDLFFRKPSDYFDFSAAALLQGFLLDAAGEKDRALEAWRRGVAKNWRAGRRGQAEDENSWLQHQGTPILHNWIMASLTGDMTDAEAEELISAVVRFGGKEAMFSMFTKHLSPRSMRESWRSARAREVARRLALREMSFLEYTRAPVSVFTIEGLRDVCFSAGSLTEEQENLLWRFMEDFVYPSLARQAFQKYLFPLASILRGSPNLPGMGWKELSVLLESEPRARGVLAYVLGQRYLKVGKGGDALVFFKSAVADAGREPPDPLLGKLAREEIDRLQPP